ncbi:Gfo/Idh/MocA family oxidoreductase [Asticcacaulis sp. DW145]|uniref:Gfo/Idh/MocA family protein n=1 Tax=Asticcacaulis sp. DW145 TaxID=3095608 RepID=UPI003089F875|nr:Gfo/Idh/MocA family oxidoreductase [Asticcacaulis sp. DW145]
MMDRRKLLIGAGGLPLAASAAATAAATAQTTGKAAGQPLPNGVDLPEPPKKRLGWAVVGLGSYAINQVISGFLQADESRMTAFVSGNPAKAKDLAERYGVAKTYGYDDFDKIAADKDIDCVYIVLPVGLHAEYTIRALKAGKHVLCEKPMASTVEECEAMVATARAANRQLGVAYRVHFEPLNIEVKRRCKQGELGDLRYITGDAGFNADPQYPPMKWRLDKPLAGGGSMYDIGIYALNGTLMLADQMPDTVSAVYAYSKDDPRFKTVEGGLNWRMTFPSGLSAQGSSSYCYAGGSRIKVFGASAAINMDPASDYYDNRANLHRGWDPGTPVRAAPPYTQFAAQVDGFSQAARSNTPHRTPGEMGLRDIRLIQAMYRSADQGGVPVKV